MFCINHRVGILYRENLQKKSYELRYFFIDDTASLYYLPSLAKIQKVILFSKNIKQIKPKLQKLGQKYFDLNRYNIGIPKQYSGQAVIPFSNRVCFDIKDKDSKGDEKTYLIFGLADQDTVLVHQEMLVLTGKVKKNVQKKDYKQPIQQKQKQTKQKGIIFQSFIQIQPQFSMPEPTLSSSSDNQYEGQRNHNNEAQGKGRQILLSKGITFRGEFMKNMKHGSGYIVNQHLDTLQCQFYCDQIVGI